MEGKRELTLDATVENIAQATAFVEEYLEKCACPMKTVRQLAVAVDEIFANIANYAYQPGQGQAVLQIEYFQETSEIEITFRDNGIPFDPLQKEEPDVTLSAEERRIGGLGIYVVKKSMDKVTYEYRDGQNVLKLRKKW